jgi:hypothetical protein
MSLGSQTWRCTVCQSSNNASAPRCSACGRPAPNTPSAAGANFASPTPGSSRLPSASPTPAAATAGARTPLPVTVSPVPYGGPATPAPATAGTAAAPTSLSATQFGASGGVGGLSAPRTPAAPTPGGGLDAFPAAPSYGPAGARATPPPGVPPLSSSTPLPANPLATPGSLPAAPANASLAGDDRRARSQQFGASVAAAAAAAGGRSPTPGGRGALTPEAAEAMRTAGFSHPQQRVELEAEVALLRGAVAEAKKYGAEIEATVEYLTDLLRRKTIECESLRTLAAENYEPVRRAILEQYRSQARVEKTALNEQKFLQHRIESLYGERTTFAAENSNLRDRVLELERQLSVARAPNQRVDAESFFNRAVYGEQNRPPYAECRVSLSSPAVPLMSQLASLPTERANDVARMGAFSLTKVMLDSDIADRLYRFGFWDFLQHFLKFALTEQAVSHETLSTCVSSAYKEMVQYRAEPPEKVSAGKNQFYAEKIASLYTAFLPDQLPERDALLALHQGAEFDLWQSAIQDMADIFEERQRERDAAAAAAAAAAAVASTTAASTGGGGKRGKQEAAAAAAAQAAADAAAEAAAAADADGERPRFTRKTDFGTGGAASPHSAASPGGADAASLGDDVENSGSQSRRARAASRIRRDGSASPPSLSDEALGLHTRIALLCLKHNPQKLRSKELDKLMQKYPPEVLLTAFVAKYGPEPEGAERQKLLTELVDS